MLLHYSSEDMKRLGLYDAGEVLKNAVRVKEQFEILMLAAPGVINPSEIEPYAKHFNVGTDASVDDDMKEFDKLLKAAEARSGRKKD